VTLPQDVELEKWVLGAAMANAAENFAVVAEILDPADFAADFHRVLFEHMAKMADNGEKIDRGTVARSLHAAGKLEMAGGIGYLTDLTDGLPRIYNLDSYCETVQRKSLLRQAILTANSAIGRLCTPSAGLDDLEAFKADIAAIADESKTRRAGFRSIKEVILNEGGGGPQAFLNPPQDKIGIPWPWAGLTRMIGGLAPGQVICLSAATGVGKTTMLTQTCLHAATLDHCVAILSMEMSSTEQAKKIISQHGQTCLSEWLRGETEAHTRRRIIEASNDLYERPIFFDDRTEVTPAMLRNAIERMRTRPAVVGVDYAQLMDSGIRDGSTNREQHVAHISRSLKRMAMKFGCAFIVLSQLNEEGKVRESRALENDATFHISLERRPGGVYKLTGKKTRFGAFGRHIELRLDGETGLFTEVAYEEVVDV
jgi:replicative DNA helicase